MVPLVSEAGLSGEDEAGPSPDAFYFREGWDSVSPSAGPGTGGTLLTVHGYGLGYNDTNATAGAYVCDFTRGAEHNSTAARALSPGVIACPTPEWGAYFGESAGDGLVSLSVRRATGELVVRGPQPYTPNLQPSTLNPQPATPNPSLTPQPLKPDPQLLDSKP